MITKSIGVGLSILAAALAFVVVFSQPLYPSGGLLQSSRWDPDGSDSDQYVWDNFTLPINQSITEIHWHGGFDPAKLGSGGAVIDFVVAIYASIPGGSQPDVINPPLAEYNTGGNAGQTPAGTIGGIAIYDYHFTLPTAFQATAGTRYWVQIEALQHGLPDWGISRGSGGNSWYFRRYYNGGDIFFQLVGGDASFSLVGPGGLMLYLPTVTK